MTGTLGRPFGVPSLIYHPNLAVRLLNGIAFELLLGWICFVAHTNRWMEWARRHGRHESIGDTTNLVSRDIPVNRGTDGQLGLLVLK